METQYYRAYARVDLDAIKANVLAMKEYVNKDKENNQYIEEGQDIKMMAVIKADAYGHGAIPISRELENIGVDYIAVAIYQEGVQLRKEGVKSPILVLGNTPVEAFDYLIRYDLAQTVYSIPMGMDLAERARTHKKPIPIHLKIDTGMGRLGLVAKNRPIKTTIDDILSLSREDGLNLEGIFTHFAKADEEDKAYTHIQVKIFNEILDELEKIGELPRYIHASNSAGLIDICEARYNMVRAGISLYGLYPSPDVDHDLVLKPALSIISRVVFLKEVEAGESISYGGIYVTDKKTKIATIPFGYADGYSRALSNRGRVVIKGQYAPVIGRVCMDMIMVDVTDIEGVKENDDVYLIGGGDVRVSVEEIADIMHTINYEVVCLIGKRVPRVYVKENKVVSSIDYF